MSQQVDQGSFEKSSKIGFVLILDTGRLLLDEMIDAYAAKMQARWAASNPFILEFVH